MFGRNTDVEVEYVQIRKITPAEKPADAKDAQE